MPTPQQALECVYVCQMLSNFLQDIRLFRYDANREIVYIIAGVNGDLEISVPKSGSWRFIDE